MFFSHNIIYKLKGSPELQTPMNSNKIISSWKTVKFVEVQDIFHTHSKEDYDRTAEEITKLTYRETLEMMQMRLEFREAIPSYNKGL